jgi:hypothetical protein
MIVWPMQSLRSWISSGANTGFGYKTNMAQIPLLLVSTQLTLATFVGLNSLQRIIAESHCHEGKSNKLL